MRNPQNRTLLTQDTDGHMKEIKLRFEDHDYYKGFKYIISDDDFEMLVGIAEDEGIYFIGDRVRVSGDIIGYICPGIHCPGKGYIASLQTDAEKHFYGVQMDNGEFGFMESSHIRVIE